MIDFIKFWHGIKNGYIKSVINVLKLFDTYSKVFSKFEENLMSYLNLAKSHAN